MISPQQISQLSKQFEDRIPELLDFFEIEYITHPNRYSFACPIHGGDNKEACSIFIDGKPNWSCWTHSCQDKFKKTIFGFIRGVLSNKANREVNMYDTVSFCEKFLNCKLDDMPVIEENKNAKTQNRMLEIFDKKPVRQTQKIDRGLITSTLKIPSQYYVSRGYSPEVLKKFDIGDCVTTGKLMYNRAVAPVYDESYNYVGCTGRIIDDSIGSKWKNSSGFTKAQFLYGLNLAKDDIIRTGIVILVEGQGDVWKAHEAGFKNTVGIMGANLSDEQLILLECSGCLNVVILTDMDKAGREAAEQIVKKCGRRFNYHVPDIPEPYKDIGDFKNSNELKTFLEKICQRF